MACSVLSLFEVGSYFYCVPFGFQRSFGLFVELSPPARIVKVSSVGVQHLLVLVLIEFLPFLPLFRFQRFMEKLNINDD